DAVRPGEADGQVRPDRRARGGAELERVGEEAAAALPGAGLVRLGDVRDVEGVGGCHHAIPPARFRASIRSSLVPRCDAPSAVITPYLPRDSAPRSAPR